MPFMPIEKMMERVSQNGDSDSQLFHELLYTGEFITKLTVLGLVSSIDDDRHNSRYQFLHTLVRADGIGEWAATIQRVFELLTDHRKEFTERLGSDKWQYRAVLDLQRVLSGVDPSVEELGKRVNLVTWFTKFAELRNKTRGHGAITPATCAKLVPRFKASIVLVTSHNPVFRQCWAYLHRNLSGKYQIVRLSDDITRFSDLNAKAKADGKSYPDGIYLWARSPRLVPLLQSDVDVTDFFVSNGGFNGRTFELHSPITDDRRKEDASPYLAVPNDRPPSETEGSGDLDFFGEVATNLPSIPKGYVRRPNFEKEVMDKLMDDRHPIVTLVGRGGIGKTSLTLTVLHEIAHSKRYDIIIWFSARDIDLTPTGPKVVQPKTVTEREIVDEYRKLISGIEPDASTNTMVQHMRGSSIGPTLFVFDNFETVRHPIDLYRWIDANIRLPNKAAITSRFRDFKADYPIEISGMEHDEAKQLIARNAEELNIVDKVGAKETEQIIEDSDGHPYVIKIVLGEMADKGYAGKPARVLARKDDILDALFERTYENLSPLASRIFLTLSGWRSLVPQLAVEAVLQWRSPESVNPESAVDELVRMSLIERAAANDGTDFLGVPVAAALFGRKKLDVSPQEKLILADIQFLQELGPTTSKSLQQGSYPRIRLIFKRAAERIGAGGGSVEEMRPMLEFIAQSYPRAWLLFADLEREVSGDPEREAFYVRRFLEQSAQVEEMLSAWKRLVLLYRKTGNVVGACSAFLKAAEIAEPDLDDVSSMANYINGDRRVISRMDAVERRELLKPLAQLMEAHRQNASATDLSRMAWLYLRFGEEETALCAAREGLDIEPYNDYCRRLVRKLKGINVR